MPRPGRPELTPALTGAELLRWCWLKRELIDLARQLGVPSSGGKGLLTQRLAAVLDGRPVGAAPSVDRSGGVQLVGALTALTVIPPGQRCSRAVRAWFTEQLGAPFHFDAEMRALFAAADGTTTLQDALDHFQATRGGGPKPVGAQFEYNRFTRTWREQHPGGSRDELLTAWREYRRRPIDERGRA
jgi:hypothetical protein